MDNLEQFIKRNRADMDKYEPPKNAWRGIKSGLRTRRTIVPYWFSAAAVIIVVLGAAIILYSLYQKKNYYNSLEKTGLPVLKETEVYYNSLVNALYIQAKPLLTGQPEIARELSTDMAQLDSICADLKKDLKDNVANQEVIEALIQNYRIKLKLLEDMLSLLKENENKSEKTKGHEL
jgi:CHASE3 domain sensor protein